MPTKFAQRTRLEGDVLKPLRLFLKEDDAMGITHAF